MGLGVLGAVSVLGYSLGRAHLASGRRRFLLAFLRALSSLAFLTVYELTLGL